MQMKRTDLSDVTVLSCDGRLNMVTAPRLRSAIEEIVKDGRARIVTDLNEVEFIDSSGLGALISGLKTCRQAHGDLRLTATGDQVLAVLKLTNLDRILRPYPTVDEATRDW